MSLRADFMAQKRLDEEEKEIKTIDQLKAENDSLKRQLQFEFDETLLQYSNTIEDLQKQLKDSVMKKCPQCGEVYLNSMGCELYRQLDLLKSENEDLENQLKREKEKFEKHDKLSAMFIQDLKNEKSSLVNEYLKKIGELLSENEELKEYIKHLHNLCGNETDKQYQYKQTLTEIKEIAEELKNFYEELGKCECLTVVQLKQILQKISEVEE